MPTDSYELPEELTQDSGFNPGFDYPPLGVPIPETEKPHFALRVYEVFALNSLSPSSRGIGFGLWAANSPEAAVEAAKKLRPDLPAAFIFAAVPAILSHGYAPYDARSH